MLGYFKRAKSPIQVGVLVDTLNKSTLSYGLINIGNKIANGQYDVDFYAYIGDWQEPPATTVFPILQYRNALACTGTLISTSLDTTMFLRNMHNAKRRIYYIWNLDEHLTIPHLQTKMDVFQDRRIELITRSKEYAYILSNNFNRHVGVCEDFDSNDFLHIIHERKEI